MRYLLAGIIVLYQRTLSLDHGLFRGLYPYGYCRHFPTCSEYARQSILKYGVFRGVTKSGMRILHCHPFAKPSVDVP